MEAGSGATAGHFCSLATSFLYAGEEDTLRATFKEMAKRKLQPHPG